MSLHRPIKGPIVAEDLIRSVAIDAAVDGLAGANLPGCRETTPHNAKPASVEHPSICHLLACHRSALMTTALPLVSNGPASRYCQPPGRQTRTSSGRISQSTTGALCCVGGGSIMVVERKSLASNNNNNNNNNRRIGNSNQSLPNYAAQNAHLSLARKISASARRVSCIVSRLRACK